MTGNYSIIVVAAVMLLLFFSTRPIAAKIVTDLNITLADLDNAEVDSNK